VASAYITNQTPKSRYRESLGTWNKLINKFALLACDYGAQDRLSEAHTAGELNLEGDDNDPTREILIEKIIAILVSDTPTERSNREVDMLSAIRTCERQNDETTANFAGRFISTVWIRVPDACTD